MSTLVVHANEVCRDTFGDLTDKTERQDLTARMPVMATPAAVAAGCRSPPPPSASGSPSRRPRTADRRRAQIPLPTTERRDDHMSTLVQKVNADPGLAALSLVAASPEQIGATSPVLATPAAFAAGLAAAAGVAGAAAAGRRRERDRLTRRGRMRARAPSARPRGDRDADPLRPRLRLLRLGPRWLLRRDPGGRLRVATIQGAEGERLLAAIPPERRLASWHLVDDDGRLRSGGAGLPTSCSPCPAAPPSRCSPARAGAHRPRLPLGRRASQTPLQAGARAREGPRPRADRRALRRGRRPLALRELLPCPRLIASCHSARPVPACSARRPPARRRDPARLRPHRRLLGRDLHPRGPAGHRGARRGRRRVAAAPLGMGLTLFPGAPAIAPVDLAAPVRGRWVVINSPPKRLPSHGTHGQGQTYAADFVFEPEPGDRPRFGEGAASSRRRPSPRSAAALAPADGRVVAAADGGRDHRSRSSWPALAMMIAASFVRELAGHAVRARQPCRARARRGVYAVLGHLQRGSVAVRAGDRCAAGTCSAGCARRATRASPTCTSSSWTTRARSIAAGLPFTFDGAPLPPTDQPIEVT